MGYILRRGANIAEQLTPETVNLLPGAASFPIVAGTYLQSIVLLPTVADTIDAGYTPAGTEFEGGLLLTTTDYNTIVVEKKFAAATTIYITGLTAAATAILYKR